jgi:hypothetical protein
MTETLPLQPPADVVTDLLNLTAELRPEWPRSQRFEFVRETIVECWGREEDPKARAHYREQLHELARRR